MSHSVLLFFRKRAVSLSLLGGLLGVLAPRPSLFAASVTLNWDASPSPDIVQYRVYYGVASATYTHSVPAGTNLTVSISNLAGGLTYYFAATATDINGTESDYSAEIAALIPLNQANRPPTLNALANLTLNENAGPQTVNLLGISSGAANESQTLTVTASSSNPGLIPTPTVNYTSPNASGTLSFTPVAYAYGSATITVTVNDGATVNNLISRSFTVTVKSVNQPPTLNALPNLTLNQGAGRQTVNLSGITAGAPNESQTLTVTASSSNPGLIPTPAVNYTSPNTTGSLSFTPVATASGAATITVTVNDGGASNNLIARAFTVTVNPANQPPTISALADYVMAANTTTPPIPFTISDPETDAASLTLAGNSDNPGLVPVSGIVFGGSGSHRTVTLTPRPGQIGSAHITLTVSDGANTFSRVFLLTVRLRPEAPVGFHTVSAGF